MFQLDLKRAEVALAGGRLEEAYGLVQKPVVREHRDGQRLVDELIDALLIRASRHLDLDRLADARHDADLALTLGGRKPEVAEALKQVKTLERKRIEQAIAANDFEFALATIAALSTDQLSDPEIIRLVQLAVLPLANRGLDELVAGRLDRAVATDNLLAPVRRHSTHAVELHDQLKRCNTVGDLIRAGRHAEAERELSLLSQTNPAADWIVKSRTQVSIVIESLSSILSGPIGLLSTSGRSVRVANQPVEHQPTNCTPARSHQWLLQVDGIGGLLLHRDSQLTVGAAASSSRFDLAIQTDGLCTPLSVRRNGDDYFAESSSPFRVNDQPMTRRLLVSGDQVGIGQRGRIRFSKPVPASASAVLLLTGAGLARRDIRSVVMLSDSLLFAKSGGHFSLDNEPHPIVVYCQGESLAVRLLPRPDSESQNQTLRVGESIVVGQTRFALAHYSSR